MVLSINSRMLIVASLILVGFFGVTGVTLDNAFRVSAEDALKERLQLQLYALIASMEQDEDGGMRLAYEIHEPRLFNEGSGLYAQVVSNRGNLVWQSDSMKGIHIPLRSGLRRGVQRYDYFSTSAGEAVLAYSIGLTWGEHEKTREGYTFTVAETLERMQAQISRFRSNLWGLLAGLTVVLLVMLTVVLRWGLAPLRRVADDLGDIEAGRHLELEGDYPRELRGLTDNLNALIHTNREHEERYRASLGDLAHSLKTPLAVLRGAVEVPHQDIDTLRATVEEQVARMDQIVDYQLQRAAASGRKALAAPLDMLAITTKVASAMKKVYAEKSLEIVIDVAAGLTFHCDEGDLLELLGNLIDNACKYCLQRVEIRVVPKRQGGRHGVLIEVLDDGPGISEEALPVVLKRGGRLDTQVSGHGLGLAIIKDIVDLYDGCLSFGRAPSGGAVVMIWLPG